MPYDAVSPLYSYKYASKKCKNGSVNMAKKRAHYGISFTNRRLDVVFYYSCME